MHEMSPQRQINIHESTMSNQMLWLHLTLPVSSCKVGHCDTELALSKLRTRMFRKQHVSPLGGQVGREEGLYTPHPIVRTLALSVSPKREVYFLPLTKHLIVLSQLLTSNGIFLHSTWCSHTENKQ